jgi:hypothetical protein
MLVELNSVLLHLSALFSFCHLHQIWHWSSLFHQKTVNNLTGICMLLTILEEQAMDSLLLGSDKQNDFMCSILHMMQRQSDGNALYLL